MIAEYYKETGRMLGVVNCEEQSVREVFEEIKEEERLKEREMLLKPGGRSNIAPIIQKGKEFLQEQGGLEDSNSNTDEKEGVSDGEEEEVDEEEQPTQAEQVDDFLDNTRGIPVLSQPSQDPELINRESEFPEAEFHNGLFGNQVFISEEEQRRIKRTKLNEYNPNKKLKGY